MEFKEELLKIKEERMKVALEIDFHSDVELIKWRLFEAARSGRYAISILISSLKLSENVYIDRLIKYVKDEFDLDCRKSLCAVYYQPSIFIRIV